MSRFLVTFFIVIAFTGFKLPLQAYQNNTNQSLDSLYYSKCRDFVIAYELDSGLYYAHLSYDAAIESGNIEFQIKSSRAIAYCNRELYNFDQALNYYNRSIEISLRSNEEFLLSTLYNDKGILFQNFAKYDSALANYYQSLDYAEKMKNYDEVAFALNNIGTIYNALENYQGALNAFLQSLDIKLQNNITDQLVIDYQNIGVSYYTLDDYQNALKYLDSALGICDRLDCTSRQKANIYSHFSEVYLKLNRADRAKEYLSYALVEAEASDFKENQVLSLRVLADIEKEEKNYESALDHANRSLNIAQKNNFIEAQKFAYKTIFEIYEELGDFEKAFKYQQLFTQVKDSLFNEEVAASMRDVVVNYETREAQETISQQNVEIRQRRQINFLLGLSIILTIAIIIRFFLDLNRRKAMNERLDQEVEKKTRELTQTLKQLQESKKDLDNLIYNISHEIRGPLATLMGLIKVGKMEYQTDDKVQMYLDKLDETADSLNSILKRMIIINSINHYDTIVKNTNVKDLIDAVIKDKKENSEDAIQICTDYDGVSEINTDQSLLETAIENIIDNSIRYRDPKEKEAKLEINLEKANLNGIDIILSDNGIGFDEKYKDQVMDLFFVANEEAGEGIGLHHAKLAIQKMGGKIEITSTRKPTTFVIHLPDMDNNNPS